MKHQPLIHLIPSSFPGPPVQPIERFMSLSMSPSQSTGGLVAGTRMWSHLKVKGRVNLPSPKSCPGGFGKKEDGESKLGAPRENHSGQMQVGNYS